MSTPKTQTLAPVPTTLTATPSTRLPKPGVLTQPPSRPTAKTCYSAATPTQAPKTTALTPPSTVRTGRPTLEPLVPPKGSSQQCTWRRATRAMYQVLEHIPHSHLFIKSLQPRKLEVKPPKLSHLIQVPFLLLLPLVVSTPKWNQI